MVTLPSFLAAAATSFQEPEAALLPWPFEPPHPATNRATTPASTGTPRSRRRLRRRAAARRPASCGISTPESSTVVVAAVLRIPLSSAWSNRGRPLAPSRRLGAGDIVMSHRHMHVVVANL